jgi:outer membrane immunogenic protein
MTKKIVAAAFLMLTAPAALAADLQPSPYLSQVRQAGYFWQGPYVGANLGYQWGSINNNPTDPSGAAGGFQAGYNIQNGQFVFGAETDLQFSGASDRFAPWKFSNPWFGTLRARAGLAMNNILFYGTAGLAYGGIRARDSALHVSESQTHMGWAAGVGLEVGLTRNWSARMEYLYVDLSERGYAITGTNNGLQSNVLRFGVNYRF